MHMALVLIAVFVASVLLVHGVWRYALRCLLDIPNARSSHQVVTPRGGGLGVVLAYLSGVLAAYGLEQSTMLLALAGAGFGVALIGFWDDHVSLAVRWRLLAQFSASFWVYGLMQEFPVIAGLAWLGPLLTIGWLMWSLNLFNFMDGIDGIAASEACFVSSSLAGFCWQTQPELALQLGCFAAASAGFLWWNWPPAKIFMGDVGSGFMGFMLGAFILLLGRDNLSMVGTGCILYAVFVADASFTLARRLLTGQKFYQAHCSHAYQIAARRYGHVRVLQVVWIINLAYLLPLAILSIYLPAALGGCLLLAYLPLIAVDYYFNAGAIHTKN